MSKATPIDLTNSQLHKITFLKNDVLKEQSERIAREKTLREAAQIQGNAKFKITFESKFHGLLTVTAPILMSGDAFVVLKGGKLIPKRSIVSVKS
ncbi:hypothetical protein N8987_06755 [Crocinitomix sp.]|nr:hypothetical protein [Crocinitomix sp.]